VKKELKRRKPDFDGTLIPNLEAHEGVEARPPNRALLSGVVGRLRITSRTERDEYDEVAVCARGGSTHQQQAGHALAVGPRDERVAQAVGLLQRKPKGCSHQSGGQTVATVPPRGRMAAGKEGSKAGTGSQTSQ
jgi:hypothetical protein